MRNPDDFTLTLEEQLRETIGVSPIPMTDGEWALFQEERESVGRAWPRASASARLRAKECPARASRNKS